MSFDVDPYSDTAKNYPGFKSDSPPRCLSLDELVDQFIVQSPEFHCAWVKARRKLTHRWRMIGGGDGHLH